MSRDLLDCYLVDSYLRSRQHAYSPTPFPPRSRFQPSFQRRSISRRTFGPPSSSFKWCHRCKKVGHLKEQCRKPPKNLNKIQCFRCGALGHIARQCLAPASLVSIPPFVSDTSGPQSATAPSIHPSATDPSIRPPASGSSIPPFVSDTSGPQSATAPSIRPSATDPSIRPPASGSRSEERRVGKECLSRRSKQSHQKKS